MSEGEGDRSEGSSGVHHGDQLGPGEELDLD